MIEHLPHCAVTIGSYSEWTVIKCIVFIDLSLIVVI